MRIKKKDLLFEERIKRNIPIPKEVKTLHKLFTNNGFKLYLVGGAVRDNLMGKSIKDYDLATDANPTKVEEILNSNNIKNIGTGKQFGVINAFVNGEEFEIATFRVDSKEGDGRRPDSVTFTTIENDVKRRDLTINALFYDIGTGEVVDLVGGIEDIKNGVIRAVGDASERFDEDRLRILRAIRFAGRVGSNLDSEIDKTLRNNNSLEGVSGERIRDEFTKGIKTAKSSKFFLSLIDKYGLFESIFKGLNPINKNFMESNDVILVIARLLSDVPFDSIQKKLNRLNYSSDEVNKIVFLVTFYQKFSKDTFAKVKKLHILSKVSDDTFRNFCKEVGSDLFVVDKFINFNFSVKGDDVKKQFNLKDGPELGKKIKDLEYELFTKN